MLPVLGPWTDTRRFTDVAILVDIAERGRDAAVGVCMNRNVTGDVLARVAANANFTSAVLDVARPEYLMQDRDARDQVTLVLAAHAKSAAAGARLLQCAEPDAVLSLHHQCTTTRFKGATQLMQSLRTTVASSGWMRYAAHPQFVQARTLLGGHDPSDVVVPTILASAGDRRALLALTDRLAALPAPRAVERDDPEAVPAGERSNPGVLQLDAAVAEQLLLSTAGNPDVVTQWAATGGAWGALVCAYDHRQSPDLLLSLRECRVAGVSAALAKNPALPFDVRADLVGKCLADSIRFGEHNDLRVAFTQGSIMHQETEVWADGVDRCDPTAYPDEVISSIIDEVVPASRLFLYDLITQHPGCGDWVGDLLDLLLEEPLPQPLRAPLFTSVHEQYGPEPLHWIASEVSLDHHHLIADADPDQDLGSLPVESLDVPSDPPTDDPFADVTCAILDSGLQYFALYEALHKRRNNRSARRVPLTVAEACRNAVERHPSRVEDPFNALLPNALGAL